MRCFATCLIITFFMAISLVSQASSSFAMQEEKLREVYKKIGLSDSLDYEIFVKAINGYQKWKFSNNDVITIIDFSKPSFEKRCYVIDLAKKKLLHKTYVTHGKNSGFVYAQNFSNKPGSHQSSIGFFSTGETYYGKYGYSLRLDGLERNKNHLARKRAIVMHPSDYAKERFVQEHGRLGRSLGCPAIPPSKSKPIIKTIKDGSCLFIYAEKIQLS